MIRRVVAAFITDANPANGPQDLLRVLPDTTDPHEQALVLNMLADAVDSDPAICHAIMEYGRGMPLGRRAAEVKALISNGAIVRFGGL